MGGATQQGGNKAMLIQSRAPASIILYFSSIN